VPDLTVAGEVALRSNTLAVRYTVRPVSGIVIPVSAGAPGRRDGLWKETCLECFLALKDSTGYWEFNLSPAGCWNAYSFSGYREGMKEEKLLHALPFSVVKEAGLLSLALELHLDNLVRPDQALDLAVSALLQHTDGNVSYWALTHCGAQPDFHRRDSFIIEL
jgi:hypothetical protein